jgi:hypothetical protein
MLKVAGIEGVGRGAEIHWESEWSGTSVPPNLFQMDDRIVVTDNAVPGSPAVSLKRCALTLTPTVMCGDESVELDPIVLSVEVDLVPIDWQDFDGYGCQEISTICFSPYLGSWDYYNESVICSDSVIYATYSGVLHAEYPFEYQIISQEGAPAYVTPLELVESNGHFRYIRYVWTGQGATIQLNLYGERLHDVAFFMSIPE